MKKNKKLKKLIEEQIVLEMELAKASKRLIDLYDQMGKAANRIIVSSEKFLNMEEVI